MRQEKRSVDLGDICIATAGIALVVVPLYVASILTHPSYTDRLKQRNYTNTNYSTNFNSREKR